MKALGPVHSHEGTDELVSASCQTGCIRQRDGNEHVMQAERISCLERQLQDSAEALEDESTHHQADMASIHQKLLHLISCMQVSSISICGRNKSKLCSSS